MCWHFNYACPDPFPMFYKTDQQYEGEEEPTSVAPPQLKQMSTMFRILLANGNKTKNILEINKEVEADAQNNCVKSCYIIPLNSFKDTFLWLLSRVTGSVLCFCGVRSFLFPPSMQKASRVRWITGITDACDRTHHWIRGSALRGDEFQPPDSNPKTAWVELFHLESEWKSQSSTQPGAFWQPGHLPGHEHYVRNPAKHMPRTGWRHFSNGEIVLHAKCYHIANSPRSQLKLPKWMCFF